MTRRVSQALEGLGLPAGDLARVPDSPKCFPDGAQYRVEIPSVEGPGCMRAVLTEAKRLNVTVHRVSQGSGVFMLTDRELEEMAGCAASARVEVSLFARPNAGWDASAMVAAPAGGVMAPVARGQDQVVACLDDAATKSWLSEPSRTSIFQLTPRDWRHSRDRHQWRDHRLGRGSLLLATFPTDALF